MATSSAPMPPPRSSATQTDPDQLIAIKLTLDGTARRFKLRLRDLSLTGLEPKLREVLNVKSEDGLKVQRFSDSASKWVDVNKDDFTSYKQLFRAAKAKQKLRMQCNTYQIESKEAPKSVLTETQEKAKPEQPAVILSNTSSVRQPPPYVQSENTVGKTPQSGVKTVGGYFPQDLAHPRSSTQPTGSTGQTWQVFCNNCDTILPHEHFHCSICDNGDFDLCQKCVDAGVLCYGPDQGALHWLIKRTVQNGVAVNSTTEIFKAVRPQQPKSGSTANSSITKIATATAKMQTHQVTVQKPVDEPRRTCNACVRVLPEKLMVNCKDCPDFDICMSCLVENKHGHHPAHTFAPISPKVEMGAVAQSMCSSGRNVRHAAICDGCDKSIYGIRHKCLECPDFDYCSVCVKGKQISHPHRFVSTLDKIEHCAAPRVRHFGVYCDGPLCNTGSKNQSYIDGVRYKCAVCPDMDFCAKCEAHPRNSHNKTHPLIKFKTMVQNVRVDTFEKSEAGKEVILGDSRKKSMYTLPVRTVSSGTTLGTNISSISLATTPAPAPKPAVPVPTTALNAEFVRDLIPDGQVFQPNANIFQIWTVRNPGPHAWPVGCYARITAGDAMLDIDTNSVLSAEELSRAQCSNATTEPIQPGKSFDFRVKLRAPAHAGNCISFWRIKGPDGMAFGHKLWCDIRVVPSSLPSPPQDTGVGTSFDERDGKLVIKPSPDFYRRLTEVLKMHTGDDAASKKSTGENESHPLEGSDMIFPKLEKESPAASTENLASATSDLRSVSGSKTSGTRATGEYITTEHGLTKQEESAIMSDVAKLTDELVAAVNADRAAEAAAAAATAEAATAAVAEDERTAKAVHIENAEFEETEAEDEVDSFDDDEDEAFLTDEEYDILDASDEDLLI